MKECPNCGAGVKDEWGACPKCTINLQEAERALGRDYYIPPDDGKIHPIDPTIPLGTEGEWTQRSIVVNGETKSVLFHDSAGLPTVHIPSDEESNLTEEEIAWVLDPERSDLPPSRPSAGPLAMPATRVVYESPVASTSRTYVTQTRDPIMISSDKAPIGLWFALGMMLPAIGVVGGNVAGILALNDLAVWGQIATGIGILLIWLTIYGDAKSLGAGNVKNVGNFLTKIPPIIWLVGSLIGWPLVPFIYLFSRDDIWQAYLRGRDFGY
ncbi:zinc ribbon domain-containing protein [Methanosphaerula subterraneus]|uniref:zinc ribbon domain-containing protein n=1 Tax=Methanosphaerula subterraneus TaxID=3350244 RepID=UPI003F878B64